MKEQLISFDTAKLAKQKGFNIICRCFYNTDKELEIADDFVGDTLLEQREFIEDLILYEAPTQALLQKWLEDKHNLYLQPKHYIKNYEPVVLINILKLINTDNEEIVFESKVTFIRIKLKMWKEKGLQEALKLIKS